LRDDGVGYVDYVEHIIFLFFLKMADEREEVGQQAVVLSKYNWSKLVKCDGDALEIQYRHALEELGKEAGMLGTIFRKAQNKIQDPAKLERLIKPIEKEAWSTPPVDVKGEIYEGLLERNAQDAKGGAGQYYAPRALIQAMVDVMQPNIMDTFADQATGTGGFLLAAYDYMAPQATSKKEQKHLRGNDIVDRVTRLCAMNLYLHGIGSADGECPVISQDALAKEVNEKDLVDIVLANPPFGKKSSITIISEKTGKTGSEKLTYEREDFWATTSNKQLNFVQHIVNMLKIGGKAAVVVPDNVLFEGGAGETIRKNLLERTNLHTILRLPTGIFYAQGVNANVIFFDNKPAAKTPWTKKLWIYDFRTNVHMTLKTNRLKKSDFEEFIKLYKPDDIKKRKATWDEESGEGRWRSYSYDEVIARDKTNLDIFWPKDDALEDTDNLPAPDILAAEIVEQLEAALEEFRSVEDLLAITE
jgi:type I restriction enzyme M protein